MARRGRGSGWFARLVAGATLVVTGVGVAALVPQTAGASTPICQTPNGITTCPTSAPDISYSPSTIAFGYIANNGGSSTQSVTFTNTSSQTVALAGPGGYNDGVGDSETGITCSNNFNNNTETLAPGQSCTATITLKFVNGVTDTQCSPSDVGCESGWAPIFGVTPQGSSTSSGFYVPFTATIGPPPPPPPCHGVISPSCTPPAGEQAAQGCVQMPSGWVVGMVATPDDRGYWIAGYFGQVDTCGDATDYGELATPPSSPIVGIALDAAGTGYWLVGADGAVYSFGSAAYHGSMAGKALNSPIVGMAADPATGGYWLLGADGGVFAFDAPFYGSTGNIHLNKPVVGMAATADGGGYWFVASDGGIFAYGDAGFHGSMGGKPLNRPVVGMAPDFATGGYWLVAADGGIFSFDAPFYGSTGNIQLAQPIVGMEAAHSGSGYRFCASDGGIFSFGSSGFYGSAA